MSFTEHIQGLRLGRDYTLYEIDLRQWNQGFFRIYNGDEGATEGGAGPVVFGGYTYSPWPIETDGWRKGTSGTLPRPKFTAANVNRVLTPLVLSCDGFRQAPFTRIKTYERYLDFDPVTGAANPNADSTQHQPADILEINRITHEGEINGVEAIQWEIISPIDRPGSKIPKIVITQNRCQRTYRRHDGSAFSYTNVTCPYAGTDYFDTDQNAVSASEDKCSQDESGCKARYGDNAVLPALFFPGVEKVRAR